MDVVISFDPGTREYRFYEPTSDTLLISKNLGEGFSNLNHFLVTLGKVTGNILMTDDISYHIDSVTFRSMIESNLKLLQRLQNGQSEFKTSSDKFGAASTASAKKFGGATPGNNFGKSFGSSQFGGSKSKFGKSDKKWKT